MAFSLGTGYVYLLDVITDLSLTTSNNIVLDCADTRSYDGSSQTWTDASGSGNDYWRGATSTATATDPTFVGTAGIATEGTYFSCDGGDYFTETTNQTFANSWHRNNGALTFVFFFYMTAAGAGTRHLWGNEIESGGIGINIYIDASDKLVFGHTVAGAGSSEFLTSVATFGTDRWNFAAVAFDEATTTARLHINGVVESFTPATSIDGSTPNDSQHFCADGVGTSIFDNGDRFAATACWSIIQSEANVAAIYTRMKRRFPSMP